MEPIVYFDRKTGKQEIEKVYGQRALNLIYGTGLISHLVGTPLMYLLSALPFCSAFYGFLQKLPSSRNKIQPFIKNFGVDPSEFLEDPAQFSSFNDFFIRRLKPDARLMAESPAVIPADGRYRFFSPLHTSEGFVVKGQKFDLTSLLQDAALAAEYEEGTMVMARLCPSDYHRFHFPCDCIPGESRLINGWLYSVNPIAVKKNIDIFTQNKRTLCTLQTEAFGKVLYMEIGATNVGSIHQTYTPEQFYRKGDEKGYFSFGASALILIFRPGTLQLDQDLLAHPGQEIKCLLGQSLGFHDLCLDPRKK